MIKRCFPSLTILLLREREPASSWKLIVHVSSQPGAHLCHMTSLKLATVLFTLWKLADDEKEEEWGRRSKRGAWEALKLPEESVNIGWEARRVTGGKEGALEEPQRVWYGWDIVLWGKKENLESWAETIKTWC